VAADWEFDTSATHLLAVSGDVVVILGALPTPERAICASVTRSRHHTAWAGALAVAAELSRREYDAAIALGNTPTLDLVCSSPGGTPFKVHVKSVASPNWILIQKSMLENPSPSSTLYFAVVLVPSDPNKPFAFHVLTHKEVCALYAQQRRVRRDGRPYKAGMEGLSWSDVSRHRDAWHKLPE